MEQLLTTIFGESCFFCGRAGRIICYSCQSKIKLCKAGVCIKCHSCVRNCPMGAKYFDDPAFLSHRAMLERDYTRRAEDKIFTA